MNIATIPTSTRTAPLAVESLAVNSTLTENQKIAEASKQFEAILLRQFLSEAQKPMFKSTYTDNSSEAGIYQDMVTNQLADKLAHAGGIGLAQSFQHQLTHRVGDPAAAPEISHP